MTTFFKKLLLSLLILPGLARAQFNYATNDGGITITGYTGSGGAVVIPSMVFGYNESGLPVTAIGDFAFENDADVTSVTIPSSVNKVGQGAFENCAGLESITIPNNVTEIGDYAFDNCAGLGSVTVGDGVGDIGQGAFKNCAGLSSLTLGNKLTSIEESAFENCPSLANVTIPSSVSNIGDWAFANCASLSKVYFEGNSPALGSFVFANDDFATVYYLPGTTVWGSAFGGLPTVLWNVQVPTTRTPLGTWEVTISGKNQGIAFLTFDEYGNMSGYGMELQPFGMFTVQGSWTLDARNNLVAPYTQMLSGESFAGTIMGKATTGKRLLGKAVGSGGSVTLSGIPFTTIPDVSGVWSGSETQQGKTAPESITITPSVSLPGVFEVLGSGSGPTGYFTVSGQAIVTSKGKSVMYSESDFAVGGAAFGSWTGSFNVRNQRASFTGVSTSGVRGRAKFTR